MTARESVARVWHEGSDHADHSPFGGPLCNCDQVAERIMPMLTEAWAGGYSAGHSDANPWSETYPHTTPSPYEIEENQL